jgi:hypothetical protein
LNLSDDYVIQEWLARMGETQDVFYRLDENGNLLKLDCVYSTIWAVNEYSEIDNEYRFFRDFWGEKVSITQDEYAEILAAYNNAGQVKLEWTQLLLHKQVKASSLGFFFF